MKHKSADSEEKKKISKAASRRGKRILRIVYWCFAILGTLLLLAVIFRDFLIRKTVTAVASYATGVEVTIDEVDTSLWTGTLRISNLKIGNPKGYDDPYMLQLEHFFADVDLGTLFSPMLVVEKVCISGLHAQGAIGENGKLNLMVLNENVQRKFPAKTESDAPAKETEKSGKKQNRTLMLRLLTVENSTAGLREDHTDFLLRFPIDCEKRDLTLETDNRSMSEKLNDFTDLVQSWCNGALHASGALIDAGKSIINQGSDAGKTFATPVLDFFKNSLPALKK